MPQSRFSEKNREAAEKLKQLSDAFDEFKILVTRGNMEEIVNCSHKIKDTLDSFVVVFKDLHKAMQKRSRRRENERKM